MDKRVFYESMDLAQLMALCEVQGLPKTGTKLVLIEQLLKPAAILEKIALKAEAKATASELVSPNYIWFSKKFHIY